jgi:hypothetical protein
MSRLLLEIIEEELKVPFPCTELKDISDICEAASCPRTAIDAVFFAEHRWIGSSFWDRRGTRNYGT